MISISVIIPIYYGKGYISSLVHQIEMAAEKIDFPVELILVNDAPEEKIEEIVSATINIKVMNSKVNRGIHGARVWGVGQAEGRYVLFLDQDDYIMPEYFKSQLENIGDNDAVVCNDIHDNRIEFTSLKDMTDKINLSYLISQRNPIRTPGQVLLRKKSIPEFWMTNIVTANGADDWFLWIAMMKVGCRFVCNDAVLFEHVLNDGNASSNQFNMAQSEKEVINVIRRKAFLEPEELALLESFEKRQYCNRLRGYDGCIKKGKIYEKWMRLCIKGGSIGKLLSNRGIRKVAIYGAGELGELLLGDLKNSEIDVLAFIDKDAQKIRGQNTKIVSPDNIPAEIDAVVISLVNNLLEIKNQISKLTAKTIFTWEELLEDVR